MDHEADQDAIALPATPGKDEMNFAEFPIALLTDRAPKGQKSIKFEDTGLRRAAEEAHYPQAGHRGIGGIRPAHGHRRHGRPRPDPAHQAEERFHPARGGIHPAGADHACSAGRTKARATTASSFRCFASKASHYIYDNAWWDARQKKWTTRAFNIIDNVEINDSRASNGQGGLFPSRIVWNEVVFDSFQAGFLRNIDFQLCMRLEHPTALRMYRFLGKRFYIKPDWTFDLKEFAYEHIGLGRNYEGGTQIARKLKPAIARAGRASASSSRWPRTSGS